MMKVLSLLCAILVIGCGDPDSDTDSGVDSGAGGDSAMPDLCRDLTLPALALEPIGPGFRSPIFMTQPAGDTALYVVEQAGRIQRVDGNVVTEFANISGGPDGLESGGERGLLGLAFHPDYATNGRYFVYYTPNSETANRVEEWSGSEGGEAPVRILINENDPEPNHNGGDIAFGPDGFLYVGMGDGGGGGDRHGPVGSGLNLDTMFGKLHRLDVDNSAGAFVAAGNPFEAGGARPQIWAYGLRNPWRFSFDRSTGDLYIGDVGQGEWEEIDFQPRSSTGGENYGWRAYEGLEVFNMDNLSEVPVHAEPVHVYDHSDRACSVTGGYVYRGSAIPDLVGWYLFADFCTGEVSAFRMCDGEARGVQSAFDYGDNVTSFGEDQAGEIYVLGGGQMMRIIGG